MPKLSLNIMGFFILICGLLSACASPQLQQPETQVAATATQSPVAPTQTPAKSNTPVLPTLSAIERTGLSAGCSPIDLGESLLVTPHDQTSGQTLLIPVDPSNWQPLCNYEPLPVGKYIEYAFSMASHRLAIIGSQSINFTDPVLHLVDLSTFRDSQAPLNVKDWIQSIRFNPAGTQVALVTTPTNMISSIDTPFSLTVLDASNQETLLQKQLANSPVLMEYTPAGQLVVFDGEQAAKKGQAPFGHLLVVDSDGRQVAWELTMDYVHTGQVMESEAGADPVVSVWGPAAQLSKDGHSLYILQADQPKLTVVDLATQQVTNLAVYTRTSLLEQFLSLGVQTAYAKGMNGFTWQAALSEAGKLYAVGTQSTTGLDAAGNPTFAQDPLGLQVIDVRTGNLDRKMNTPASNVYLADGDRLLLLEGWQNDMNWTKVYSTADLKLLATFNEATLYPISLLNGKTMLLNDSLYGAQTLQSVDPHTLQVIATWDVALVQTNQYPLYLVP